MASSPAFQGHLPTQTQLYALYTSLCASLSIKKPNRHILDLLEEDNYNRRRQVADVQGKALASEDIGDYEPIIPLSERKSIPDMHRLGHLGTKGVLALIGLLAECPSLEEIDLTHVPSIFCADPYKEAPSGNVVVDAIAKLMAEHAALRRVYLCGHPLGTLAACALLRSLECNGRITVLEYDGDGVAESVRRSITHQLEANRRGENPNRPLSRSPPGSLSPAIQRLAQVDRKSSAERLALKTLLDTTFGNGTFSDEEVLSASSLVTLGEASLRGSKDHLYLIEHGEIELSFGPEKVSLRRGDYFGEPVNDVLHSSGLMSVRERGTAFAIPLAKISDITRIWADAVTRFISFIRKVPLFQPLHMWVMCRLCHQATLHIYKAGDVVADGLSLGMCVVESGSVKITSSGTGALVAELTSLDVFGHDTLLLKGNQASRTTECSSPHATILRLDEGVVRRHVLPVIRESLLADLASWQRR